jgi:hypothetical protein
MLRKKRKETKIKNDFKKSFKNFSKSIKIHKMKPTFWAWVYFLPSIVVILDMGQGFNVGDNDDGYDGSSDDGMHFNNVVNCRIPLR